RCFPSYSARVVRNAASSSRASGRVPITRSISEWRTVARLSVMITESINSPDPSPPSLATRTTTRLGCPARAMLLVIIATIVWGNPESSWSAWTTSAGRSFDVRRFESGNNQNDVTAAAGHRTQPSPGYPNLLRMGPTGGADRPPGPRRFLFEEDPPGPRAEPTSRYRASPRPRPAAPVVLPSRCGRRLRPTSPCTHYAANARVTDLRH